jgi:hypothetical protein
MSRTTQQNRALHLWLARLAEALNDAGFSLNDEIVFQTDISFTKENLKENAVHPVMRALFPEVDSTAKLSKTQIQDVYLHVDRAISLRTGGVTVAWPTEEDV